MLYVEVYKMKLIYSQPNHKEKFIKTAFKSFYKKKNIIIGFAILYIYTKNEIV